VTGLAGNGLVRVMTWNIHGGVGPDGRYDLERITGRIAGHAPDLVAVQEIDSRGIAKPDALPLAALARSFGPHAVEARTVVAADGHYGHAVVSRWPLVESGVHDLSVGRHEPRGAIDCTVATPFGRMRVVAAHLGLDPRERGRQAAMLAAIAHATPGVTLVLGDFNDWLWRGPVRRALAREFRRWTGHRTFPARLPCFMLDRIYCRPAEALVRSWADPAGRLASDHLPVVADIRLGPAGPAAPAPPALSAEA
jgi:endonuclease/exonuclease/phosphatase family metal-dependent hydrolase